MISLLHPAFLCAALGVAGGVVALHFIVTEQLRTGVLPTVRFFPDLPARASTLTLRLSDLILLALRVITVLLVGAAFAQPRINPRHQTVRRLVAIDVSRNTRSIPELADSALPYIRNAAAVILFDSTARQLSRNQAVDALRHLARPATVSRPPGALSPAMIAALRAAASARESADSLEIVIVSPLTAGERDAATLPIRSRFPGHVRVVRVLADTAAAPATQRVHLEWADSGSTSFWVSRARPDTVRAVGAEGRGERGESNVLVYPFVRRWRLAKPTDQATRVVGRWLDGEPAVVERSMAGGCVRSIAFALPAVGDAILRPDFARFSDSLDDPCGDIGALAPLSPEFVRAFEGPARLAPAAQVPPRITRTTTLVPLLLAAALLVALAELIVRRRLQPAGARQEIIAKSAVLEKVA